jgi:uncharacterized protein
MRRKCRCGALNTKSSGAHLKLETLVNASPGSVLTAPALRLRHPISFWGDISPVDGRLIDTRSEDFGACIAGKIVFIQELRGSSSSSSVLLELAYKQVAPRAIVLTAPDAILALGALVAAEMQWNAPSIFKLDAVLPAGMVDDAIVSIDPEGELTLDCPLNRSY